MSAWDKSHWVDYDAEILNTFAGPGAGWIEFRYTIGYVGWRPILGDTPDDVANVLRVAIFAMQSGRKVRLRVTNGRPSDGLAEITAIQTLEERWGNMPSAMEQENVRPLGAEALAGAVEPAVDERASPKRCAAASDESGINVRPLGADRGVHTGGIDQRANPGNLATRALGAPQLDALVTSQRTYLGTQLHTEDVVPLPWTFCILYNGNPYQQAVFYGPDPNSAADSAGQFVAWMNARAPSLGYPPLFSVVGGAC